MWNHNTSSAQQHAILSVQEDKGTTIVPGDSSYIQHLQSRVYSLSKMYKEDFSVTYRDLNHFTNILLG
jgi:hypothetical protein